MKQCTKPEKKTILSMLQSFSGLCKLEGNGTSPKLTNFTIQGEDGLFRYPKKAHAKAGVLSPQPSIGKVTHVFRSFWPGF